MGSFDTELDLFSGSSMRHCFVDAQVLPNVPYFDQSDADDLRSCASGQQKQQLLSRCVNE